MLNVVMLSVIMMSVIMLNVVMLSVVTLNALAPNDTQHYNILKNYIYIHYCGHGQNVSNSHKQYDNIQHYDTYNADRDYAECNIYILLC
jgi:hypothetical protein